MTYAGMNGAVYMDGSSEVEQQSMMTGMGPSTEPSWGDNGVLNPYAATYQSESTQARRVRPFLQVMML